MDNGKDRPAKDADALTEGENGREDLILGDEAISREVPDDLATALMNGLPIGSAMLIITPKGMTTYIPDLGDGLVVKDDPTWRVTLCSILFTEQMADVCELVEAKAEAVLGPPRGIN